ncbi:MULTISPECIES: glycerophosphodiester phosphodiesterase [unclassified Enterococcus]|uniref:glycerophosphodiester phosphodiesterase n=1 Tax=unclassified Enterococcus TaxID=2608891 RepID=UPI0015524782|nr:MULTISPECIES: glycerophosphodiester phosphodiesterase [unclassified Enterococcus]MBS7577787.1 glycerophosphodiester phosphodiesterase [Enterococcus sp. MMGLQ5-2]MBS7585047.1 glycerophosphodiester phosphodiesterase [Enterococcus sp. MMGLQ5-1]NPD12903.1 glycerophosphodiester phosphodiesterase [Enterococcus sp. MMGLQ5-1]NPD37617.1 glycerophosphodiester phosphodiesterase [Enterococcus sp. MMGLQ5-2]
MSFIDQLKTIKNIIQSHLYSYLKNIIIIQGLWSLIISPLIVYLFLRAIHFVNLSSLTEQTVFQILQNPLSIISIILIVLITCCFTYFEQAYFINLVAAHKNQQTINPKENISKIKGKFKYFLSFQFIFLVIYFFLMLPIVTVGMNTIIANQLKIPNFIIDELLKTTNGKLIYGIFFLIILFLNFRLMFTISFFIYKKDCTIFGAIKKSWQYTQKNQLKIISTIAGLLIIQTMLIALISFTLYLPLTIIEKISPLIAPIIAGITITAIQGLLFFSFGILQLVIAIVLLNFISPVRDNRQIKEKINFKSKKIIFASSIFLFITVSIVNIFTISQTIYQPETMIIAHRGYTANHIENTIASLKDAAKIGADYVELDVQETKDEQWVVFHDTTLSRLSSHNDRIKDLTLAEINNIELKQGDKTDKIPSLREFISVAKSINMPLLIEIKTSGTDSLASIERLMQLIKSENQANDYLIQTLNENTVQLVKQASPETTTGILVALNIGRLPDTQANFIGLEEFSVNQRIVRQAENEDKKLFVWTVNHENLIQNALRMNVDGIITNNPAQALKARQAFENKKTFVERVKLFIN